jgi:hypothetical protein
MKRRSDGEREGAFNGSVRGACRPLGDLQRLWLRSPFEGMKRDALPEMPIDVRQETARTYAQGYRRFRCPTCGKQFNERSNGLLNRTKDRQSASDRQTAHIAHLTLLAGQTPSITADLPHEDQLRNHVARRRGNPYRELGLLSL